MPRLPSSSHREKIPNRVLAREDGHNLASVRPHFIGTFVKIYYLILGYLLSYNTELLKCPDLFYIPCDKTCKEYFCE